MTAAARLQALSRRQRPSLRRLMRWLMMMIVVEVVVVVELLRLLPPPLLMLPKVSRRRRRRRSCYRLRLRLLAWPLTEPPPAPIVRRPP